MSKLMWFIKFDEYMNNIKRLLNQKIELNSKVNLVK
jgi:hypothetical protein